VLLPGRSFEKLGLADGNLAEFAGSGQTIDATY
jgi:hypothetical protein